MLFVNIGLFIATVIAAIIAWKQTSLAIAAKNDAVKAQNTAEDHASSAARSATAGERSAAAQEQQTRLAEEAAARAAARPWSVEKTAAHRWTLTNDSGLNVDFVRVESDPIGHLHHAPSNAVVRNGESVWFEFGGGMADPASVNVVISWRSPVTRMQEQQRFSI